MNVCTRCHDVVMNERFCADKTVIRTLSHVRFKGHSGETGGRGRWDQSLRSNKMTTLSRTESRRRSGGTDERGRLDRELRFEHV